MTSVQVRTTGAAVDDTVRQLVTDQVATAIAAKDPTVWGTAAEPEAAKRLGWVDAAAVSRPMVAEIEALRASFAADGVDSIVLCGMGGSSLAPEVITRTAGTELTVLDSTEPSVVARALERDLQRTAVVVSSKSGSTLETDSQLRVFRAAFEAAGIEAGRRIVIVTDPGSQLHELAESEGYRFFLADQSVGGRYSALTAFGLVPSGLAGADIGGLLDEAESVRPAVFADDPANPALVLGSVLAGQPDRDKVLIVDVGSGITGFGAWAEQLLAESTGKQGRGLLPVPVEDRDAPELAAARPDAVQAVLAPVKAAGTAATGLPTATICGPLGAQLLTWETATAVAGRLLGINPFDQPDVESAKSAARGLLEGRPDDAPPDLTEGPVEVRGSDGLLAGVRDLPGAVEALLDRLGPRGYLAVMAYLDSQRDSDLFAIRATLAARTQRPVTFGWGPRFLHSTGQYHKGGPPDGVFLQVTASAERDVPIPDRDFTFGQLIAAQAAGDARVLADHDRPVLRLHLTDPSAGVARLTEVLR